MRTKENKQDLQEWLTYEKNFLIDIIEKEQGADMVVIGKGKFDQEGHIIKDDKPYWQEYNISSTTEDEIELA